MLRYIAKTLNLELVFWKNFKNNIVRYSDSDDAKLTDRREYTKAYIFIFTSRLIFYFSKF